MSFSPWQEAVLNPALLALEQGRLSHALLLVGPARLGKHELAEVLAKRLLCATPGPDGLACGNCRSCHLFAAQTVGLLTTQAHPDLQRIGLEPNDKGDKLRSEIIVEQIRRLGQWFSLTPQFGGAQVAIIEPADLMNVNAGNALLKTLEEPASNRYLLIVSARPGRLPATVRSRCQRLEFRLPSPADGVAWLRAQGFGESEATAALQASRGNPGLAAHWIRGGGMQLRSEVAEQLDAVGKGRAGPIETAQRWLGDESAEQRLRFASELALEAAARLLGAAAETGTVATPTDFPRLSAWFDALNRVREQLRAPLRHDLVLAGLLHEWRTMFEQGR